MQAPELAVGRVGIDVEGEVEVRGLKVGPAVAPAVEDAVEGVVDRAVVVGPDFGLAHRVHPRVHAGGQQHGVKVGEDLVGGAHGAGEGGVDAFEGFRRGGGFHLQDVQH